MVSHIVAKSLKQWIFVKVLVFDKEIDVISKNYYCVWTV